MSKTVGGSIDRAETMRARTDEKLRKITESAFDAIVMVDENGRVNYWNTAAETMFGYTKDEALGKDVHTLLLPGDYTESFTLQTGRPFGADKKAVSLQENSNRKRQP